MSNWNGMVSTRVARAARRKNEVNAPPKPRLRKPSKPWRRKNSVRAAIRGTGGNKTLIARRLGCTTVTLVRWLNREDWEDIREAIEEEKIAAVDRLGHNAYQLAMFEPDPSVRAKMTQWLLERLKPDTYASKNKIQFEGGDKPIQHEHRNLHLHANVLDLPVEKRLKIMEIIEDHQRANNENG